MLVTYCTTLDDAYYFLNRSKGLPDVPRSVPLKQRYLRATVIFSWIALEEMLDYSGADAVRRRILRETPRGSLLDRLKVLLSALGRAPLDRDEFLSRRAVRNHAIHRASSESGALPIAADEARQVFDYCLNVIRDFYPTRVGLTV